MPNYGSAANGTPTAMAPGDRYALFSNETPTFPQASIAIAVPANTVREILFTISAPTATVQIQGANEDNDAAYNANVLHTTTNTSDYYYDYGAFAFYRAKETAGTGAVTVEVHC